MSWLSQVAVEQARKRNAERTLFLRKLETRNRRKCPIQAHAERFKEFIKSIKP